MHTRARAAADPPKRALRRDRTRDPGGWRFRRDAPSGGASDARGREAGGVERESRRGHLCVCSVCGGGGGSLRCGRFRFGSARLWGKLGRLVGVREATRACVCVARLTASDAFSRKLPNRTKRGYEQGLSKPKRSFYVWIFVTGAHRIEIPLGDLGAGFVIWRALPAWQTNLRPLRALPTADSR